VDEWEAGTVRPTIAQLRKAAAAYKRPLAFFFLPAPPDTFDAMRDFRRHQDSASGEWSPELHGEYRRALLQRENALELAEIEDAPLPVRWRITDLPDHDDGIASVARRAVLADAPLALPRSAGSAYDHLNAWVAALEEAGILVLATRRGGVSAGEMRAFSLYSDVLPVVVVNGGDGPRGRLFSLLHEYAHLLLHTDGLCDAITDTRATTPNRRLEARCNAIAASILMPSGDVLARPEVIERHGASDNWDYDALRSAAAPFGVSAEAFLRRLVTLGRATASFYQSRREEFVAAYEEEATRSKPGGGNWYRTTARDLGKGYVRRIADAHKRRAIDSYTAASFLDVKVDQISGLAEAAAIRVPA
jgi:Zn-dependent peptidase ImmA (M78 family)